MSCPIKHRTAVKCQSNLNSTYKASRLPIVILPGFLSNNTRAATSQYTELRDALLELDHPAAEILPASTIDWLPTLSGGSFLWYLERLASCVQELSAAHGSQVCLVGVSAGGWLARLAIGSVPYKDRVFGLASLVHTLVCLGTPHQSLEAYPFGRPEEAWVFNQHGLPDNVSTSLQYANHFYPDADSLKPTRIVCVAGSAVCGGSPITLTEVVQVLSGQMPGKALREAWFLQQSYLANCGDVSVDGDGVTPIVSASVPGAETLVLPGVWHNKAPGKKWYGTPEVVAQWDKLML